MNTALWILQAILAVKCLTAAFTHAFQQDKATLRYGIEKMGAKPARLLLGGSALALLLASLALLLPALIPVLGGIVPYAAAMLAALMLGAAAFHRRCREKPMLYVSLILFALSALLAYGRWALAPL